MEPTYDHKYFSKELLSAKELRKCSGSAVSLVASPVASVFVYSCFKRGLSYEGRKQN